MKKTLALILAVMILCTLTACAGDTSWTARYESAGSDLTAGQIAIVAASAQASATDVPAADTAGEVTLPGGLYAAFIVRVYQEMLEAGQVHSGEALSKQMVDDDDHEITDGESGALPANVSDSGVSEGDVSGSNEVPQNDAKQIPADQAIDRRAKELVCEYIVLSRRLNDLGIKYVRDEYVAGQGADSYNSSKDYFSKLGIGLESFLIAFLDYDRIYDLAFTAAYGKGGYAEVPEDYLMNYFQTDWMKMSYISRAFYNEETGMPLTEEEKADLVTEYDLYTQGLNLGLMDFVDMFSNHMSSEQNYYRNAVQGQYVRIETMESTFSGVSALPVGEFGFYSNDYSVNIVHREVLDDAENSQFYTKRDSWLRSYKESEFKKTLSDSANALDNVIWNDNVFKTFASDKLDFSH